ncbi:hypothetical protein FGF1_02990 [Flavobacteriaceae bacterium GF1]
MKGKLQLILLAIFMAFVGHTGYGQAQIGQTIEGEGYYHGLGRATSLSEDGNTVAIGCWGINYHVYDGIVAINGSVRVYGKSAVTGQWEQIGETIAPETNHQTHDAEDSGRTISLSNDGTVLAIGARGNDGSGTNAGHVRVYERDANDNWVQVGSDIDGTQAWSESGWDVGLSGDGTTVAIGARFFDVDGHSRAGQVRVFKRGAGDNWVQLGSDIVGGEKDDQLGMSVSLSDDGNTLAITASNHGNEISHGVWETAGLITRVYRNDNGSWVQMGGDFMGYEGTLYRRWQGGNVELTGDGNALVTTGYAGGFVRVYQRDANDNWTLKGNELKGAFGNAIALSDDANILAVGERKGFGIFHSAGGVRIYKYRPDNTWEVVTTFNGNHNNYELGGRRNSLSLSSDGSVLAMGASDYGFIFETEINLDIGRAQMYHIGVSGVSIEGAPATINTTDPFEVTFKFDRGVADFNEGDIVVANATISNFKAVDASEYTAEVNPMSICGDDDDITINVPASSAFDRDSNMPNLAAQEVVVSTTGVVAVAQDITVQLAPNGLVTISPGDVDNGSGDNCEDGDAVTLSLDKDTFDCGDLGTPVTVTLTATSGNQTDSTTAVVTVEDYTNGLVAVSKDITVTLDADGTASIGPGQVNNGSGSGCNGTGAISLSLDKNVFTCEDVGQVTVTLTVEQGNQTATATATVTVEENLDNLVAIVQQDITVQLDASGQATISPDMVDNGSNYGCGNTPELSLDRDTFDCGDVGTPVTVTLTAAQGDNSDTATAVVTVAENLGNLVANAKDITVWLDTNGQATISPGDVDNGSTYGGCNKSPSLSLDRDTFTCDDVRAPVTVTLTAAHGTNIATATALVTVQATGHCGSRLADFNRGFSPNGDGVGDTFVIEGLEKYRNNVVRIYDLSQQLLFSAHYSGPSDGWDGTDERGLVPVGSYVCVIDYNEPGLGHEAKMIYVNY